MTKYDYTNYQKLIDSFDYESDPFNPHTETFDEYVEILETFDPFNNPPEDGKKKDYVFNYILPILQEYGRDNSAILEVEDAPDGVTINIITNSFTIIKDEAALKAIIFYSTLFSIKQEKENIRLELYFYTK